MGHLNYIGMILFSLFIVVALCFYNDLMPSHELSIFVFICIYTIGTANINRCILPYRKLQPGLVFISKKLLLKHLFITIKKGYALQLFLAFIISLTFVLNINQYLIIILALVTVMISFLSNLTSGLFRIFIRLLFLLQLWFILTTSLEWAIISIILQLSLIYFYISNYKKIPSLLGVSITSNSGRVSGNISYILLSYMINNKILVILIGALVCGVTYYIQKFFTTIPNVSDLPALMIIFINFMTIMEIIIGSKREEIMLDKARIETLQASLIVSSFNRFKSSSFYILSLTLIVLALFGFIGILLNNPNIKVIITNFISIPLLLFIGAVYFRKAELLTSGYEYKLLKLTLPILMLLFVTIFTIVS
nr:hypothetical protein [Priestia flexa]WEZ10397.1 hypothetical protein P5663_21045 [Priestia flexa]WEZ10407.1 hypothetical protein P5663_20990 [Priestia flexa]